jgi:tetratricopeptide (TPR) repeat protein
MLMLLVTVTGCVAPKSPPVQLLTNELSAEDMDFAVALARYSAGIAEEIKTGPARGRSVDFFFEASQSDPSNYALARKAAIGLLYKGRTIEAGKLLEATSSLNPTNYPILLDLATIYDIGDQPEKRIATYERAVALSPSKSSAYMAAARAYLKDGQLDKALKILERGAEIADAQLMSKLALVNASALLQGGFPEALVRSHVNTRVQ